MLKYDFFFAWQCNIGVILSVNTLTPEHRPGTTHMWSVSISRSRTTTSWLTCLTTFRLKTQLITRSDFNLIFVYLFLQTTHKMHVVLGKQARMGNTKEKQHGIIPCYDGGFFFCHRNTQVNNLRTNSIWKRVSLVPNKCGSWAIM